MGLTRITILLAVGTALLAAESEQQPLRKYDVGTAMTVTAEAEPVEVKKSPNPVVVVDKKELDQLGAGTTADLLKDLFPGQVLSNGGPGTATSFFLGGARSQDVVVTLNGIRLQDPMGLSGVAVNSVSLAGVDRVEIQQGSVSSRQGANAMGGLVALSSSGSAPQGWSGSTSLGIGNRDIRRGSVAPAYGWGTGWVRFDASAGQEEQSIPTANPYRNTALGVNLGQQLGEATLLTASYLDSYAATPIPFNSTSYGTTARKASTFMDQRESALRSEVYSTTLRTVFSSTLTGEFTLGGWERTRMDPDPFDSVGLPKTRYASRGSQLTESLSWTPTAHSGMTGTLDLSKEWGTSPDYTNPGVDNSGRGHHQAFALEGYLEPIQRLRLTASARAQEDQLETAPAASATSTTRNSSAATYKLGANLELPAGFRVYVSGGTGYAHPLLYQLLFNQSNGGPDLDNEKSYTIQTGATWEQGPWKARLQVSRTHFDRLIYYDPTLGVASPWGGTTGAYANGTDIRIQSAEVGLGYQTEVWGLEGFYRNQEARDMTQPEGQQLSSQAVIRRPFQSLGLNAYWVGGKLRLDGRWSWFGGRYEYGLPFAYKAHFNDLSLSATYAFTEKLTLVLRGDHLLQPKLSKEDWLSRSYDFDNDAAMIYGFPATPPTVTLDVKYRF